MQRRSLLIHGLLAFAAFALACPAFVGFIGLRQTHLHSALVTGYYLCLLTPFFLILSFRNLRLATLLLTLISLTGWAMLARLDWQSCVEGHWCETTNIFALTFGRLKDPAVFLSLLATLCVLMAWRLERGQKRPILKEGV